MDLKDIDDNPQTLWAAQQVIRQLKEVITDQHKQLKVNTKYLTEARELVAESMKLMADATDDITIARQHNEIFQAIIKKYAPAAAHAIEVLGIDEAAKSMNISPERIH